MSSNYKRSSGPHNRRRVVAEDEPSSDDSSGLDILKQTRKSLNLSQTTEDVTRSRSRTSLNSNQGGFASRKDIIDLDSEPAPKAASKRPTLPVMSYEGSTDDDKTEDEDDTYSVLTSKRSKLPTRRHRTTDDDRTEDEGHSGILTSTGRKVPARQNITDDDKTDDIKASDDPWSEDDPSKDYREFKARRTQKRKAAAAETNRIRQQKKFSGAQATSIIGRKPARKRHKPNPETEKYLNAYGEASDSDLGTDGKGGTSGAGETYLDEPVPEYIVSRKRKLKKLHEAGLRFPPYYDGIAFSDENEEEKPVLHKDIRTQREKKDIKLKNQTGGFIPGPIAQWLRDYQIDGVQFLHERFVRQTGCILGDDMGLGKTIQVIAFLTAAFGKTATQRDAKRMRKIRRVGDHRWYPRILIVCPGTLMQNWQDELEKWGWWHADRFHGDPKEKRAALAAIRGGMSEILITTYSTYRNSESEINTIDWDCVIADECHQIKSKSAEITKAMNRVNALCRIGLTGTAIQNKYEELWNLLNWARPGDYGSAQEWKQQVSLPLKIGQAHDATYAQLANARTKAEELVGNILPDVFLRRMKSLIADQLPKKSDRVVFCPLTTTQIEAYTNFVNSEMVEYIRYSKEPCDCNSGKTRGWCCYQIVPSKGNKWTHWMFPAMTTLKKIANHVALLLPWTNDSPEKQAKDLDYLQLACPDEWRDLYRVRDSILNQSQRRFCGKWAVLKRLLEFWHGNGDKVLVFSHSVRLLRLLKTLFDIDGTQYNWSYLDGSMSLADRAAAVADFNSNPNQFVFLISTKAGGVGLNITSANKVVVMDPEWNPAHDMQAQDRAYRIGQTRDVEVFRLVSSGTIEENMYARQIYKQQQANIGYTASEERRYFKGVMDSAEKKGELFGLENMFSFEETGLLLRDIVRKTNVAETRAGINAIDFDINQEESDSEDDEALLSNKSLGIMDDDGTSKKSEAQMRKLAKQLVGTPTPEPAKRTRSNPINAILAKAGVQYAHENSEVIGESKVETELSRRALEVRNDLDMGKQRVFQGSQSQSQPQDTRSRLYNEEFSDDEDEGAESENDVKVVGEARKGEFKINYRYRPDERTRCRQFCSMAEMMGYSDPVEFALVVEDMKQDDRRTMLEKFYRGRRRALARKFK